MKELFPLKTFQQDAILKRLSELYNISKDISDGTEHLFENITDAQGHKRFIEGIGTTGELEGFTSSYCRWSLSGTHLICVSAGSFANATEIPNNFKIGTYEIPQWIADKIYPVWADEYIEKKSIMLVSTNWGEQTLPCTIRISDGKLKIETQGGALTLTNDRAFRVQFDLLIDNEQPVNP